jgi:Ca-activated chloride channel family protein
MFNLNLNFAFEWPWMLVLLPISWLLLKSTAISNQIEIKVPLLARFTLLTAQSRSLLHNSKWLKIIFICAWVLLVLALARPVKVAKIMPSQASGYDLLLAVDLSRSMEASLPSVKQVVKNFVSQRQGDRIGLIVFAEHAYMVIPLTQDINSVTKMIDSLMVGMAGEATAIGDAIALASQNLAQRPQSSRVMVLLTDGNDTSSHISPHKALEIAIAEHLKIYTIGIGEQNFDADFLQNVAKQTGGVFSSANTVDDLVKIYANINTLEKVDYEVNNLQLTQSYYRWFLNLALLGFMLIMAANLQRIRGSML